MPSAPPPRGVINVSSVKITLPLAPDQVPRDLLPPAPAPAGPVELLVMLKSPTPDKPATPLLATLNGKSYRKACATMTELGQNCVVLLQGKFNGDGVLLEAGLTVQPKTPKPEPAKG
jgi:hypothetical protein